MDELYVMARRAARLAGHDSRAAGMVDGLACSRRSSRRERGSASRWPSDLHGLLADADEIAASCEALAKDLLVSLGD